MSSVSGAALGLECDPGSTVLHGPRSLLYHIGRPCVQQLQAEKALVRTGFLLEAPAFFRCLVASLFSAIVDGYMQVQTQESYCSIKRS